MGGAPVYVEADGIFVGKADFAERHQVRLNAWRRHVTRHGVTFRRPGRSVTPKLVVYLEVRSDT